MWLRGIWSLDCPSLGAMLYLSQHVPPSQQWTLGNGNKWVPKVKKKECKTSMCSFGVKWFLHLKLSVKLYMMLSVANLSISWRQLQFSMLYILYISLFYISLYFYMIYVLWKEMKKRGPWRWHLVLFLLGLPPK